MTTNLKFPQYFRTKEGLFCHTLFENCNLDSEFVIGLPKYFPTEHYIENGRVIEGKPYLDHLPSFHHSIEKTRNNYGQYMKYLPFLGEEVCVFNINQDIVNIYDPAKKAYEIYQEKNKKSPILDDAKKLIEIVIEHFGLSFENIGIEGSILLNCYKTTSDIDCVIYGSENAEDLYQKFFDLEKYPEIHLYDMSDIDLIFSRRYKYQSFESNEELFLQEKKRTVGLINGRRFWLQPVSGNNHLEKKHEHRAISKIDIVNDIFDIVDDSNSLCWPSFYTIYNKRLGYVQLECYDPVYANQASNGNKVLMRMTS